MPCLARRANHVSSALNVHALIGLPPDLPIDTGAMRNRITTPKRFRKLVHVVHADRLQAGASDFLTVTAVLAARDENDLMPLRGDRSGDRAPDEPGSSRNGNSHVPPFHAVQA